MQNSAVMPVHARKGCDVLEGGSCEEMQNSVVKVVFVALLIAAPYHASVALDGVSKCNHLSTRGVANKHLQPLVSTYFGAVEQKLQQLGATGGLESVASFRLQLTNNQRKKEEGGRQP